MKLPFILILLTGLGSIIPNYVASAHSLKRQEALEIDRRLEFFGKRNTH
jgi:hypothetical protein